MLDKVGEWLKARGFTLEMHVASAFRAAGFEVTQSSVYTDSENGKNREIDVLAIDPDIMGVIGIHFVVECKRTTKPWVLLCSPHTLRNYNRLFAFAHLSSQARDALVPHLDDLHWMKKEGLIGYSLREAFSDDADRPFAAASSVANACDNFIQGSENEPARRAMSFVFPIIVVDGPLVRASLSQNGDVNLEEVEEGEFLFLFRSSGACIRVLTASRVANFAIEAKRVADQIRSMFKLEERKILEEWMRRHPRR